MLRYKDYVGEVKFEGNRLIVKILHIDDSVTDEFDAASDAQSVFEALVDDYIETCTIVGKEPCKPFKGSFNVRVTPRVHREGAIAAASIGQSLNAWVQSAMEEKLERSRAPASLQRVLSIVSHSHLEGAPRYEVASSTRWSGIHTSATGSAVPSLGLRDFGWVNKIVSRND